MRRFLALTAFFLALVFFAFGVFAYNKIENFQNMQPTVASMAAKDAVYLLVGVDRASYSSDVIMLVRVENGALSILQIPRDSLTKEGSRLNATFAAACNRVKNEGGDDRAAYAAGGRALADKLSRALGVTVNAHATMTLNGLSTLVDAIGGVEVTLDTPISYEGRDGQTVTLSAGKVTLDGGAAEGLVRCRKAYPDADYGRMRAQRRFIEGVFEKLRTSFSPLAMFSLFRRAYSEVETDLAFKDALPLMKLFMEDDVRPTFATLVGAYYRHNKAAVEVLNEKNLEKASQYLGGDFNKADARAVFYPEAKEAQKLYESVTPPPFTVSGERSKHENQ